MQNKYGFPVSTPESQGISSREILGFINEIENEHIDLQSLIIMRNGHIITEGYWAPFGPNKPHRMFSSRKALIGAAILFTIQEGLLDLETRVMDVFPEKVPSNPCENIKKLNYYHMLSMSCGHAVDSFAEICAEGVDRPAVFFQQEFRYKPGVHFLYDNGIPDMLCQTITRLTGKSVLEYLQPLLFDPLGMESFCAYTMDSLNSGLTICCSTPDLFRLTAFYYQGGKWQGRQLLDERLARMACSYIVPSLQDPEPPTVAYDTRFGYGFQIWRNSVGGFRIDGAHGQFGIGIPEMNLVACMNAEEGDQNIIPVLFWKHITSHLYARPIKQDEKACTALEQKLQSLTWAALENQIQIKSYNGEFVFSESMLGCKRIRIEYSNETMTIATISENGPALIEIGAPGKWKKGWSPFIFPEMSNSVDANGMTIPGYDPAEVYTSGRWVTGNKFEMIFQSDSWIASHVITLEIMDNELTVLHEDGITYSIHHRSSTCKPINIDPHQKFIREEYLAHRTSAE